MNRSLLLALPISLMALVACSSNNDNSSSTTDAGDDAPDTTTFDAGDDTAPDTIPTDANDAADTEPVTKPEGWDPDYGLPGVMGESTARVASIVVTAKRWIYVGGLFHHAGDVVANNVAVWNGAKWNALADGLPGEVLSLAANASDEVFAVVNKGSDHIVYKWDKTKWTDLTAQPDGQITSIDVAADGSVWIAGYFEKLGTKDIKHVARYKDGAWSAVGTDPGGFGFEVVRATTDGACVGGGVETDDVGVACWNGTTWTSRKANLQYGTVKALRVDSKGSLVIGGQFKLSTVTGDAGSVARWNSTESKWELLGGGVMGGVGEGDVTAVAVNGDNVYVTGFVKNAGGINVRHIAMWNGKKWFDLEGGLAKPYGITFGDTPIGDALAVDEGGELYVGGKHTRAGARNTMYISHFNGSTWSPVDDPKSVRLGVNGPAETVAVTSDGKTAYVGGNFSYVGGDVHAEKIGKLTSTGWQSLGAGLNDNVLGIALKGDEVYAVGWFTGSGVGSGGDPVIPANHIAMWNGSAWSSVGGGLDNLARVVTFAPDGKMWVGGDFDTAGTVSTSRIATWDGTKWSAVAGGVSGGGRPHVTSIVFHDGKVYVGGEFTTAGATAANNVAVFDGTSWSNLGDGLSDTVESLVFYNGKLVAGGPFKKSGDKEIRRLAVWDGTTWSELGGGLSPESEWGTVHVHSMVARANDLFVTGIIDKAGSIKVSHLAKWNGTEWSNVAGGVNDTGGKLWVSPDSLWVAGAFSGAGNVGSLGIARYWFAK